MSNPEVFDLVILGSGEAGKYLAWTFASQGKRVAVVERKYIGGSCPNVACLPSKSIIHSAKIASYCRSGTEFGMAEFVGPVEMMAVRDRKRKMVDDLVADHLERYRASGVELVLGNGVFVAAKTIQVAIDGGESRTLRGQNVVVCTGSRARVDDTPGLKDSKPLTHIEVLDLDHVPAHLIVLGGGYIGLELAQAYRRLGSRVTVVERNETLIHREDSDVTAAIGELFHDEGVEVFTGTKISRIEGETGQSVRLHATVRGQSFLIEGSHLLVAAGRTPNTDGIGLAQAAIEVDARGHVKVNERLQTTAPDVWAVGDCAASPYFTHAAYDDFRVVRDNIEGGNRVTTGRQVPFCLFTDPELARIGLNEREAKQQCISYRLVKIPMRKVPRTRTLSETRGFLKALIAANDQILGFTAFGVGAGEIMSVVQVAMLAGIPYMELRDAILTHPTIAEGLTMLFSTEPGWCSEALKHVPLN